MTKGTATETEMAMNKGMGTAMAMETAMETTKATETGMGTAMAMEMEVTRLAAAPARRQRPLRLSAERGLRSGFAE
jgi:hypothetical protein